MSLVSYAVSSDEEESDVEDAQATVIPSGPIASSHGTISDEEDFFPTTEPLESLSTTKKPHLTLPVPKVDGVEANLSSVLAKLPIPKTTSTIVEEDDEFLHKKAVPPPTEKPPPPAIRKGRVQITIPSLSEYKDLDEKESKPKSSGNAKSGNKISGLLGLLPTPKSERTFSKIGPSKPEEGNSVNMRKASALIPDSVKNRQQAKLAAVSSSVKVPQKKITKPSMVDLSDGSDSECDFFSLNTEDKLPEVSANEINAMVAKRAAEMAEASKKMNELDKPPEVTVPEESTVSYEPSPANSVEFDQQAIEALVGARGAKRRKVADVQIVELTGDQVLPNREEWLRGALASSTTYQPRGVLVDEETAPGTRRKHQITYLAHQAKANESELQAMWAANRQTRRATQSKYGF